MPRERWFCQVCGGMTQRPPGPDGRALCAGHRDLVLDAVPSDPLESVPSMAVELLRDRAASPPEGKAS